MSSGGRRSHKRQTRISAIADWAQKSKQGNAFPVIPVHLRENAIPALIPTTIIIACRVRADGVPRRDREAAEVETASDTWLGFDDTFDQVTLRAA